MMDIFKNPWFFFLRPMQEKASINLFLFHYAGGNSNVFFPWVKDIDMSVNLIGIQLPGRANRLNEPLFYNIDEVIHEIMKVFPLVLEKPFIFLVTVWAV